MEFLEILKLLACIVTIVIGAAAMIWPLRVREFIGLEVKGGRGITEVRVVLGALFIAIGALPLILGSTDAYLVLGYTYLSMGVVRLISMLVDKSVVQSNVISVITEFVFGIILVL
jgi:hypothetical protein